MSRPLPIAAKYDPETDRSEKPSQAFTVIARSIGWLALGLWLGSQVTITFIVQPVIAVVVQLIPQLVRHHDWQVRTGGYIFGGVADRCSMLSLLCAIAALATSIMDGRFSGRPKLWAYIPAILIALAAGLVVASIDVRATIYGSAGVFLGGAYSRYAALVMGQIGLIVIAAIGLVWLQTPPRIAEGQLE